MLYWLQHCHAEAVYINWSRWGDLHTFSLSACSPEVTKQKWRKASYQQNVNMHITCRYTTIGESVMLAQRLQNTNDSNGQSFNTSQDFLSSQNVEQWPSCCIRHQTFPTSGNTETRKQQIYRVQTWKEKNEIFNRTNTLFTYIIFLPPPRRLWCHLCLLVVGWLVCQQDYTKTTERVFHKTSMEDGSQPRIDNWPMLLTCLLTYAEILS